MASILCDSEIKQLLNSVIINGTEASIRSNSYVIRLGKFGEFINTEKNFELSGGKGIKLPSGHSVGVTSIELLDFSRETVEKLFPGHALHGFLTPTTDLSREGVVVASTQVDAGFKGTLCWTLTNTGSQERCYVYGERLFKLTIFKLDTNEVPSKFYDGTYQNQTAYVRSCRNGAPVGMKDSDWFDPHTENGPEELLDELMKAGYPWQAVGRRLGLIDEQYKQIDSAYAQLNESITSIECELRDVRQQQSNVNIVINDAVQTGIKQLSNSVLIAIIKALAIIAGLVFTVLSNSSVTAFLVKYGVVVGISIFVMVLLISLLQRPKKQDSSKK